MASGHYPPSFESYKLYLSEPAWFILKVWHNIKLKFASDMNVASQSTVRMSLLIINELRNMYGNSQSFDYDSNKYLPFKIQKNQLLSSSAIDIFWECYDANILPSYVLKAFRASSEIWESLELGKKDA